MIQRTIIYCNSVLVTVPYCCIVVSLLLFFIEKLPCNVFIPRVLNGQIVFRIKFWKFYSRLEKEETKTKKTKVSSCNGIKELKELKDSFLKYAESF